MRTLIIACGATKVETKGARVAALSLYAGRQFNLARQLAGMGWRVMVLSAEHGLIQGDTPIATYDRRMDAARADELVHDDTQGAKLGVWCGGRGAVVVFGGALYRSVVEGWAKPRRIELRPILGRGCGDHYSQLAQLVRDEAAALPGGLFGRAA